MNDTLKVAGRISAELGAAKAENDRLREALRWYEEKVTECRKIGSLGDNARQALDLDGGFRARDALSQQADHVRDAAQMMVPSKILKAIAWGERDDAAEAIGSLRCLLADPEGEDEIAFPDSPEPTDTFTAVEMATAAAQGFRDGQAATVKECLTVQPMAYAVFAANGNVVCFSTQRDHPSLAKLESEGKTVVSLAPVAQPEQSGLVEAAKGALGAIQDALEDAYHNAYPECCGQAHLECCGSPAQAWSEADQKFMDRFTPHEKALRAALTAQGSSDASA